MALPIGSLTVTIRSIILRHQTLSHVDVNHKKSQFLPRIWEEQPNPVVQSKDLSEDFPNTNVAGSRSLPQPSGASGYSIEPTFSNVVSGFVAAVLLTL